MGFLSKLFDPGKGDRDRAGALADQGVIKGFNFSGPGGVGGGFNFRGGTGSMNTSLGAFQNPFEGLLAGGMQNAGIQVGAGGVPEYDTGLSLNMPNAPRGQAQSSIDALGNINVDQISGRGDYDRLGSVMEQNLALSQRDPFDLGSTISDKLRQLSERKNQRLVNKMFDRLQSTGNLTSSAGIQRAGDMERNLFEQGLQFDLAGLQAGESMISNAFSRGMGALAGREGIAGRTFGESFGLEQLRGNRALQQFGIASDLYGQEVGAALGAGQFALSNEGLNQSGMALGQDQQRILQQQQQFGLQQLQMAMGMQNIPLAQMQALAGLTGLASNSLYNAAGTYQGNAAMAKSPFLEALNAAGQFAGNVSPYFNSPPPAEANNA